MKYKDILDDVLAGKWVKIIYKDSSGWIKMLENGVWIDEKEKPILMTRECYAYPEWEVRETASLPESPINLLQAIEQKKILPGDKFKVDNEIFKLLDDYYLLKEDSNIAQLSANFWMCKDFEIVGQEPDTLTSDESYIKRYGETSYLSASKEWVAYYKCGFEDGEANGVLKEQLRVEESLNKAIYLVKKAIKYPLSASETIGTIKEVEKILKGDD